MQMLELAPSPPIGFRKAIPARVKLEVVLAQAGICTACKERLGRLEDVEFDHTPALQLRGWDAEGNDTIPPANDPAFIEAKHKIGCHRSKTTGRVGESRHAPRNGDIQKIAKTRRVTKKEMEFRRRLLAKDNPDEELPPAPKRKHRWPTRPFASKDAHEKGRKRAASGSSKSDGEARRHRVRGGH